MTYNSNGVAVPAGAATAKKKLLWGKKPDPDLPVRHTLTCLHAAHHSLASCALAAGGAPEAHSLTCRSSSPLPAATEVCFTGA